MMSAAPACAANRGKNMGTRRGHLTPWRRTAWAALVVVAATTLSACGPLVGAAGAVAADNAAEENGDDGLF